VLMVFAIAHVCGFYHPGIHVKRDTLWYQPVSATA
jgi:hypothetical protein